MGDKGIKTKFNRDVSFYRSLVPLTSSFQSKTNKQKSQQMTMKFPCWKNALLDNEETVLVHRPGCSESNHSGDHCRFSTTDDQRIALATAKLFRSAKYNGVQTEMLQQFSPTLSIYEINLPLPVASLHFLLISLHEAPLQLNCWVIISDSR